jgi:cell division protein FtsB
MNSTEKSSRMRPYINIGLVLVCSVLLLQDVFGAHGILAMRRTQREAAKLRDELRALDAENASLAQQALSLRTDRGTIECVAREDIGLARPGELVFRLPAGKTAAQDPCAPLTPSEALPSGAAPAGDSPGSPTPAARAPQ